MMPHQLNLIMAQRLVRTIDENEKEEYKPTKNEIDRIGLSNTNNMQFFRGKKVSSNHNTGYKGRTAIHEILEVTTDMRKLIYEEASQIDVRNQSIKNGMTPLRDAGIEKIKTGETTIEEVLRATVEDN